MLRPLTRRARGQSLLLMIPIGTAAPRREHQLSLEDELLLTLRNERGKTWRGISVSFENVFGKPYRAPALQMRYIRLAFYCVHSKLRGK